MSQTLLEMVQDILVEIRGDEVNSIGDTEESETIARFIKTAYNDLSSHTSWPHTRRAIALTARADSAFPTHFVLNSDVKKIISVNYDKRAVGETRRVYKPLTYKDPDEFLVYLNKRDNDQSNIDIITDDSGIELLIMNDKAPDYYTSFDDVNLICDSYDSAVDSTLQESKLQAQGYIIPEFTLADDFTPDLPPDAFSLLHQEALSRAQLRLREFQDMKAEQEANKQSRWMSRQAFRVNGGIRYPDYGKK